MREKTCGCRRGVPSRLSRAQHPPKLHIPLGSCLGMVGPAPLCVTPSGPPRLLLLTPLLSILLRSRPLPPGPSP